MLEDAQSWVNGRTINEIKDIRSGKALTLFKLNKVIAFYLVTL